MLILVRENNIEQALKALKRKLAREGVLRELKLRRAYEKPSERKVREKAEAVRRARKLARKQAQREGLLPAPKPKAQSRGREAHPGVHPDRHQDLIVAGSTRRGSRYWRHGERLPTPPEHPRRSE